LTCLCWRMMLQPVLMTAKCWCVLMTSCGCVERWWHCVDLFMKLCWCVDDFVLMTLCWCVDVLTCWWHCVDVLMTLC
jgi:hypothetical protein